MPRLVSRRTMRRVFVLVSFLFILSVTAWHSCVDDAGKMQLSRTEDRQINTSYIERIEENFENMTAGASFETGRTGWAVYGSSYGTATAQSIAGSLMGRVSLSSSSYTYYMTYTLSSSGTYETGVKISFDMATGATNALRMVYILSDTSSDYWFIGFSAGGYIIAQHSNLPDVLLRTYTANTRYNVTVEFVGNMHTLDVTVNGTKYTNGGSHFSSRYGTSTSMRYVRAHTCASTSGWVAIDNIDASWIERSIGDEPVITHPPDISYTIGQTGYMVSWTITDSIVTTPLYTIYVNGSPSTNGPWASGVAVLQSVDGLAIGSYNYTIVATDGTGFSVQDTVIVNVIANQAPTITHPADISYTWGYSGYYITWIITDAGTGTRSYTIYVNGSSLISGSWTSGSSLSRNVDGLAIGSYNYTVIATDGLGGSVQDEVIVNVLNGIPTISHPSDITYTFSCTGYAIWWTVYDSSTTTRAYTIYVNGSFLASGTWTTGSAFSRSVDGLSIGSYNYTVIATDGYGGSVQDTVIVNVIANQAPTITHPADITYTGGYTGYYITWTITDAGTGTRAYTIYVNGSSLISGSWTSGSSLSRNVDGLAIGSYNYTIVATDGLGGSVQDEVIVNVLNGIPTISHPSDITYTFGFTSYSIPWTVYDLTTTTRAYTIYVNGSFLASGTWTTGIAFSRNVDGLSIGSYNYTIVATDGYGASVQDSVIVKVVNGIPSITHPNDAQYTWDQANVAVSWTITDLSTTARIYTIYVDGSVIASGMWTSGVAVTIDLNSIAPGSYNITIVVIDGYGARVQDQMWLTRSAGQPTSTSPLRDAALGITCVILGALGASLFLMLVVGPAVSSKRGMGKPPARDPGDLP